MSTSKPKNSQKRVSVLTPSANKPNGSLEERSKWVLDKLRYAIEKYKIDIKELFIKVNFLSTIIAISFNTIILQYDKSKD